MSFDSLGLSAPILRAIDDLGYTKASPIQEKAIPAIIAGKDVMAAAQTGTGKTGGFSLPLLERLSSGPRPKGNHVRALILTPTRELAAQVHESVVQYGAHLETTSTVVFGGVKINPQIANLRKGCDVLVATPGRLIDLYNQNAVKFSQLEVLVLDEADRMLDMGFFRDIKRILDLLPKQRQNLLFSATFSPEIRDLARGLVNNPVEVSVSPPNSTTQLVEQSIYVADKKQKSAILANLIKEGNWQQVLVFSKTKHGANRLARYLDAEGISALPIHGNKSQGARTKALEEFKTGKIRVLVATDIAARGLDIPQLPQVVNFDLPHVSEDYVHRIGRTGRAGETGKAYSLVCIDEASELFSIERLIGKVLERHVMPGFLPVHPIPESNLNARPIRSSKPKRPRTGHKDGQRSGDNSSGNKPANKGRRPSAKRTPQGSSQGNTQGNTKNQSQGNSSAKGNAPSVANDGANKPRRRRPQRNHTANNNSGGNR
ncbi:ATP-dependent RNA helicase RhlE [Vibrio halioticoli NBRC 102217]|uniref:ATP-dependent RNA helicase RhlE n=1 Tax=Vibrio halioticoli NBRC 102217 TaxID=1219072 RepID=V5F635_9VIBR|nr:DEAD/DEAH box helicase [Vibrio halioticoli]GAD91114.1 ATP-dependent RNA helicase RhlE [Vibrio halioticoli NBRC 102217]